MIKYSDKFLNNYDILKTAIIGMEFEFYMKDIGFYKSLEILNEQLSPVKIWGHRQYHPNFKPDATNFIITPDLSGGANLVELITGPLDYYSAKYFLLKITKIINQYGYTNDKCSIHFNISFNEGSNIDLNDINLLKFILNIDEDEIYRYYPTRRGNIYAKSIKKIIPFKEYDYSSVPIESVQSNLRLPDDKYYGVNFIHINDKRESQRLEFRYIGGTDWEKTPGQLLYFMDKFILNTYNSIINTFTEKDIENFRDYLDNNIEFFKNFNKYDNFIVDFQSIQIQIDQDGSYDLVNSYYDKIYDRLYDLIDNTKDLKNCIINYVTSTQVMEIIDADINGTATLENFSVINCKLSGNFSNCIIESSEIKNAQLDKCLIKYTDIDDSKVINCRVISCKLENCFFMGGYLDSDMISGVFRSGELGPDANIYKEVKIVTDNGNFFNTKFDSESDKNYKKK